MTIKVGPFASPRVRSAAIVVAAVVLVLVGTILTRTSPYARYENDAGGWSAEYPTAWHVHDWINPGSAAFISYDAITADFQKAIPFTVGPAPVPDGDLRIEVELWDNPDHVDAMTWVERQLAAPPHFAAGVTDRGARTVARTTAATYTQVASMAYRVTVVQRRVFLPSADRRHMLELKAYPASSVRIVEFEHLLETFTLR